MASARNPWRHAEPASDRVGGEVRSPSSKSAHHKGLLHVLRTVTTLGNEQMTNPRPAPARKGGLMHNGVFSLCVSFKLRLVRFAIHTRATTHSLTDMVH